MNDSAGTTQLHERTPSIVTGLHPSGFPARKPYAVCMDPGNIGADFYLMQMIEGRTPGDRALPNCTAAACRGIYHSIIDVLARLHSVDPAAVGLCDFGCPGKPFERQGRHWTQRYRTAQTEHIESVEKLIDWLPRTLAVQGRIVIVRHVASARRHARLGYRSPAVRWRISRIVDELGNLVRAGRAGRGDGRTRLPARGTGLGERATGRRLLGLLNSHEDRSCRFLT